MAKLPVNPTAWQALQPTPKPLDHWLSSHVPLFALSGPMGNCLAHLGNIIDHLRCGDSVSSSNAITGPAKPKQHAVLLMALGAQRQNSDGEVY